MSSHCAVQMRRPLCAVSSCADSNNYSTERLHSENRRMAVSRTQTHAMDVPHVAVRHQAHSGWPWAVALTKWARKAEERRDRKGAREQSKHRRGGNAEQQEDAQEHCPRRKKRRFSGGGGAWRAYLHSRHERLTACH